MTDSQIKRLSLCLVSLKKQSHYDKGRECAIHQERGRKETLSSSNIEFGSQVDILNN